MSLVLNVEILGEFKNLTAATKGAQSQLGAMNKRAQTVSRAIGSAFAAIGIGLSFRAIANELEQASKAAIEDAKSQKILALAMRNTAGATDAQVAAAEKSINKMQYQAGIADDQLRPAFQKLFIATKDVTESNRLLQIAMDASAGTGKSLDAVSMAMAKSLAGSDTALLRLIPSLKGATDPMLELEKAFAGAAEEAANTDPYQRMKIVFEEMQEQIGTALLPVLDEFSTWLATPEGQEKLGELVSLAQDVIKNFTDMAGWVLDNKDWLVPMVGAIGAVTTAFKIATVAANTFKAAASLAAAVGVGGAAFGGAAAGAAAGGYLHTQYQKTERDAWSSIIAPKKKKSAAVVQNINIKGSQSGTQIAKAIKKAQKATGTKLNAGMF